MSEEPKPCPFGSDHEIEEYEDKYNVEKVCCYHCGLDIAKSLWNTRPREDRLREALEKIEEKETDSNGTALSSNGLIAQQALEGS